MTKTKSTVKQWLLATLLVCSTSLLQAQPSDPGDDPDPPPSTNVPFDGGISLVIAAGIAYASKKGYDKRKKTRQEETEK